MIGERSSIDIVDFADLLQDLRTLSPIQNQDFRKIDSLFSNNLAYVGQNMYFQIWPKFVKFRLKNWSIYLSNILNIIFSQFRQFWIFANFA